MMTSQQASLSTVPTAGFVPVGKLATPNKPSGESIGSIFLRHRDLALSVALYYTRNREDARDVVQDAFLKAFENINRFDPAREFAPWIKSIVRNLSIDLLRRRRFCSDDPVDEGLAGVNRADHPENRLLRREVQTAMRRLEPNHRRILLLREYMGHSYLEIADILHIPLGTVMSRLHQARKRFRRLVSGPTLRN